MSYQALLFCPDDKTARVVTQVLSELEFTVEPCSEPFAAVKRLMAQHFDAVVVDCDNEQNATLLFKSARNSGPNQSSLSVAVVEGQAGVAKAFRIGANLVLTKPINVEQSKGTLRVARGLLRKAETVKPLGSPAPVSSSVEKSSLVAATTNATRQFVASVPVQKTVPASVPVQQATSPSPAPSTSAFELDVEPAPQPDAAEAALLEYMPDAATTTPSSPAPPAPSSGGTKEYPWQPISKPLSEPMASALRRAAETAGQPVASARPAKTSDASRGSEKHAGSFSSSLGAATAPAPAKEAPRTGVKPFEMKPTAPASPREREQERSESAAAKAWGTEAALEAPSFSSLDVDEDQKANDAGRSKKKFLYAAVAVVLVAGYFGWTKMHSANGTPAAQQQVAPAPATTSQASSPDQQSGAQTIDLQSPSEVVEAPGKERVPTTKTSSAKPSAAVPAPSPNSTTSTSPADDVEVTVVRQPIVVKNQRSKSTSSEPAAADAQAPAPEAVTSNTNDNAISGMLSTAPVSVPAPISQQIKLSQGVSQGLLVKRVAPTYPMTAKQMHLQGSVQIQANISKDGNITDVKLLSGDAVLGRAAMDAVRQWKYKPYVLNGEPIEIQTQVTVIFKLP
jgi:periplasmic protein TonB